MTKQCHNTMTSRDCIGCKIDVEGKCHLTEQPKCKTCNDTGIKRILDKGYKSVEYAPPEAITEISCPDCIEQPNTNLVIIKTIQGLMACVGDDLNKLNNIVTMDDSKKSKLIAQALEDVDLFERTTLFELQKAFE